MKKKYIIIPIIITITVILFFGHFKISQDRFTDMMMNSNDMDIVKEFKTAYPNHNLSFSNTYFEDGELRYSFSVNDVKSELQIIYSEPKQIRFNCYKIINFEQDLLLSIENPIGTMLTCPT